MSKIKHGDSIKGRVKRLYKIWSGMKKRCLNENVNRYEHYGGRGIYVCEEWLRYEPFKEWAVNNGYTDELTLDRINVNKGYSPENCRWVTYKVQGSNRSNNHIVVIRGESKTLQQWCELYSIKHNTVLQRLKYGWCIEEAITTPVRSTYKHRGKLKQEVTE